MCVISNSNRPLAVTFHCHLCGCLSVRKLCSGLFVFFNFMELCLNIKTTAWKVGALSFVQSWLTLTFVCSAKKDTHVRTSNHPARYWTSGENVNFFGDASVSFNWTGCSILFMLNPFKAPKAKAKSAGVQCKSSETESCCWMFSRCWIKGRKQHADRHAKHRQSGKDILHGCLFILFYLAVSLSLKIDTHAYCLQIRQHSLATDTHPV